MRASAAQASDEAIPEGTVKVWRSKTDCDNACRWVDAQKMPLVLPATVLDIGDSAFEDCDKLTSVIFTPDSELLIIGELAFANTALSTFEVPNRVKRIEDYAFASHYYTRRTDRKLTSVTFTPDSELRSIGRYAFAYTALKDITIPKLVKRIDDGTFAYCTELSAVSLAPESQLGTIGDDAFYKCGKLTTLGKLPADIRKIGRGAFAYTALTSFDVPKDVVELGDYVFLGCEKLTTVNFAFSGQFQNFWRIGESAFEDTALTTFRVPGAVDSVGYHAFWGSQLTSVTFEDGTYGPPHQYFNTIGVGAFPFSQLDDESKRLLTGKAGRVCSSWGISG